MERFNLGKLNDEVREHLTG